MTFFVGKAMGAFWMPNPPIKKQDLQGGFGVFGG